MLTISGLNNFYYLSGFHDMRCKAPRVSEIIRSRYHRDPLQSDVYIFMSKKSDGSRRITYANINVGLSRTAGVQLLFYPY